MATSGSTDFTSTRAVIVEDAYHAIGVGTDGEALEAADRTYGERTLNRMVKGWNTHGDHLWKREEVVVFLTVGEPRYELGPTGDRAALLTDMVATKLDGAHISGGTSISVDATTGGATGDNIGVVLADGSIYWATVSSVESGVGFIINIGLSGDADDGAVVYLYTNTIALPLKVVDARRRDHTGTTAIDSPITMMLARQDYQELPQKHRRASRRRRITTGKSVMASSTSGQHRIHPAIR